MANALNLFRNGAVGFIDWLDEKRSIFPDNLLDKIFPDYAAKGRVRNGNGYESAGDLDDLRGLSQGRAAGMEKGGRETPDDKRDEPCRNRDNDEEEQPGFEILEFGRFFVHRCSRLTRKR